MSSLRLICLACAALPVFAAAASDIPLPDAAAADPAPAQAGVGVTLQIRAPGTVQAPLQRSDSAGGRAEQIRALSPPAQEGDATPGLVTITY
ncbi:hypothetical protein [uncultured Stenotrophomonas sp.]|uniref:hypothetical protein n=1 Tax=uncultured Stenotrophomonas sp. TaxID=165438 RepID=UPI0025FB6656|nr:hypothetical protein [uncultured Stenotrophomonas sp.]